MKIGITGKRGSGKTTIFNLLTGSHGSSQNNGYNLGVASVPDERVDFLSALYRPKKTTYAKLQAIDFATLTSQRDSESVKQAKSVDALLLVLGAFSADPLKELDDTLSELVIADLGQVERSLERLESKRFSAPLQIAALRQMAEVLQEGDLIGERFNDLADQYNLITHKPMIAALNVSEDDILKNGEMSGPTSERCKALGIPFIRFSALVEDEIRRMHSPEERRAFLSEYHLDAPGVERLAQIAYQRLGLISFFTVGQDEVKAWTVRQGCRAKKAAGVIHSDIERGFIRAEVVSYSDMKSHGSMKSVKEAGLFRLESKEYQIKDGDIVSFRFNV